MVVFNLFYYPGENGQTLLALSSSQVFEFYSSNKGYFENLARLIWQEGVAILTLSWMETIELYCLIILALREYLILKSS
jgi:hypothetical protein